MKQVKITDKDNNAKFQIDVGDQISLSLSAVPGTGYAWHLCGKTKGVLKQIGDTAFEHVDGESLGGSQHQVFRFQVQAAGQLHLKLEYRRAWEKADAAIKFFSITVIAND